MSFKEEMKQKIADVAGYMQMTDEITGRLNPIPVDIDGQPFALVLHPVDPTESVAPAADESETVPEAVSEVPEEVSEVPVEGTSIDEFIG